MAEIPERLQDLLKPETRAFADLALVLSDGTPQVTPIWFDYDGKDLIINTARGRVKDRVLRKHPWVAMVITDPNDPYRFIQVRGPVVGETEEGAADMIRSLNYKYHGNRNYPLSPGEVRVTYRIKPEKVTPPK